MTQEERLDSLLESMRSQPNKPWSYPELESILPSDVRAELGRLFTNLLERKFISHGDRSYNLLPEGVIFRGFVAEKDRKIQIEIDSIENKRTAQTTLKWTKINTWFVIASLVISIIALIIVITDHI